VDLEARTAIGYAAPHLISDDLGFTSPYLDNLFSLTAGSLGLTSVFAACVARGQDALLLMGAPASGKTSASYIAARLGLEFRSDRAVFLEAAADGLRAWGDFWPATFRPDAAEFYPQIRANARQFRIEDLSFYCLDLKPYRTQREHALTPACCVFLERRQPAEKTALLRISEQELAERLEGISTFHDDPRFDTQRQVVLSALGRLPAYHLVYGTDPAEAAKILPDLLSAHGTK
jgi:hypothetical protein